MEIKMLTARSISKSLIKHECIQLTPPYYAASQVVDVPLYVINAQKVNRQLSFVRTQAWEEHNCGIKDVY